MPQPSTQRPQLSAALPIVDKFGTMQQPMIDKMNALNNNLPIIGQGSPEGVVEALQFTLYIDQDGTAGNIEYRKMLVNIGGDKKLGWLAVLGVVMGFLSGITEKVFGGTDNSQQKMQQQANQKSQEYIERMTNLGRGDANYLYPQGDYARNQGINAAMGLMGNAMPTQMGLFQDGNVSAQMQLLAGLPQYQNAILGMPVNNQAMQPTRLSMPDPSAYQQRLPDFGMAPAPAQGQSWGSPSTQSQIPYQPGNPWQQTGQMGAPMQQAMGQPMQQPMQGIPPQILAQLLGGRVA